MLPQYGCQGPPGSLVRADFRLGKGLGPRDCQEASSGLMTSEMTSWGLSRGLVGADARPRKAPKDCEEASSGLMTGPNDLLGIVKRPHLR